MGKRTKRLAPKRTLTEKAYLSIKEGIVRGEIGEGIFLSEKEIMKRYGIGRTASSDTVTVSSFNFGSIRSANDPRIIQLKLFF